MSETEQPGTGRPPVRSFWPKALGWVLMLASVGVVSCQALFNL